MGGLTAPSARARRMLPAAVAVALAVLGAVALAARVGGDGVGSSPREQARAAARAFLDRYVDPDGRVVRRDQGGDTVSEGQAYALLLAVASGDRARFDRVWRWTRGHLQRADGLLSWHWQGGRVVDPQPAADGDLDAAHALLLASRRFHEAGHAREARRIADAMRGAEIRDGVVLAGPWATGRGVVDPSYADPGALRALHMGDVADASRRELAALVAGGRPPPDWALAGPPPRPTGPPGTALPPSYGYDAARVAIRWAASCVPADRRIAARLRGLGRAAPSRHPVFSVAEAAQARAAGRPLRAGALLDRAVARDHASPSYYGAAWVALGRTFLQTDLLGACPAAR